MDLTVASGLARTADMSGWGNGIFDFDNDGWNDLFVARSNVMDNVSELNSARRYPEPNTIFRNVGKGKVKYFHNVTESKNHWILQKVVGTKSNRMGLGAQVRLLTEDGAMQWNEATTAVGYAASSDPRVHFGLGTNQKIREIEIRWPSGIKQILKVVRTDQILTIEEAKK